jgi:hypothetical protein
MFEPQDNLAEARRTVAELEAIRNQFKPTDARLGELLRRGLAMLDEDTTPESWKAWLWDVHSTLRAHIAALRLAERAGNNPLRQPAKRTQRRSWRKAGGRFGYLSKSNVWPRAAEMEAIRQFPAPSNARKLIHRWRDRRPEPDVKEVN